MYALLLSTVVIFAAEMGDKSQLMAMAFALSTGTFIEQSSEIVKHSAGNKSFK